MLMRIIPIINQIEARRTTVAGSGKSLALALFRRLSR
jgi:hypothetical protein